MNAKTCDHASSLSLETCPLRLAVSPPFVFSIVTALRAGVMTCPLLCPAGDVIVFRKGTLTSASFMACEIILPNAVRRGRGRLTHVANIPPEVSDMLQAKDVSLIHLLARCKQRQLDRYLDRVERYKKWRCST